MLVRTQVALTLASVLTTILSGCGYQAAPIGEPSKVAEPQESIEVAFPSGKSRVEFQIQDESDQKVFSFPAWEATAR